MYEKDCGRLIQIYDMYDNNCLWLQCIEYRKTSGLVQGGLDIVYLLFFLSL